MVNSNQRSERRNLHIWRKPRAAIYKMARLREMRANGAHLSREIPARNVRMEQRKGDYSCRQKKAKKVGS